MAKKSRTYRFDPARVKEMIKLGFIATVAYETGIEVYLSLRKAAIKELRGHFNKSDLFTLFNIQKNHKLNNEHIESLSNYLAFINDCYENDNSEFISKKDLVRKIEKLTSAQIYFLRMEIQLFWHAKKSSAKRDFDEVISNLL